VDNQAYPESHRGLILGASFDRKGEALHVVHAFGGRLRRFNARTGELEATLGPELPAMWFVDFSNDGTRYAANVDVDGEWHLQVRGLATGEVEAGCSWPTGTTSPTVSFTPDDRYLVHSVESSIFVRDARTGEVRRRMELLFPVNHLACSPDGKHVAATSYDAEDRSLYIFNLETGARRSFEGNVKPFSLAYVPDGSRIVTGNRDDGTVSLWDVERGLTLTMTDLEGTIQWVAVSRDGCRIAAVDSAGVHRVWDAPAR
jgi:WD40 repeat protein